ncbi:type I-E CRISPR-associated protein Cas5/CasD [Streptomyces platensis]|uniref:type I-E CRISPR-associated protein Cas5/CasD n=1 Tax=Streptomyces platensis TaxID=58346 RepID=UPI0036B42892
MNGILLRLAAPLMSFGEHAAFHYRDTLAFPTRSALTGLFAAAQGKSREEALAPDPHTGTHPYAELRFTVRIDRPGSRHTDFHTAGGGRPHKQGLRTSSGTHRPQSKSTLITHRVYLADAVFVVAVQGPTPLLHDLTACLEQPEFAPYLGRRACIPNEPLLLCGPHLDPISQLLYEVPLSLATPPRSDQSTVPLTFVWEDRPAHVSAAQSHRELADLPVNFAPTQRLHHTRRVWCTTEQLPATLYAAQPPISALTDYIHKATP